MPLTYGGLLRQVEDTVRSLNNLKVAAGATAAPLNPAYRQSEFDFYPGDCKARTLVVQAGDGLPAYKV
jgi:hypothetical protein